MSDEPLITLQEFGCGLIYGAAAPKLSYGMTTWLELDTPRAHYAILKAYESIRYHAQFHLDHHPRLGVSYDWRNFLNMLEQTTLIEPVPASQGMYVVRATQPMFAAAQCNFFGKRWSLWERLGRQFGESCS